VVHSHIVPPSFSAGHLPFLLLGRGRSATRLEARPAAGAGWWGGAWGRGCARGSTSFFMVDATQPLLAVAIVNRDAAGPVAPTDSLAWGALLLVGGVMAVGSLWRLNKRVPQYATSRASEFAGARAVSVVFKTSYICLDLLLLYACFPCLLLPFYLLVCYWFFPAVGGRVIAWLWRAGRPFVLFF